MKVVCAFLCKSEKFQGKLLNVNAYITADTGKRRAEREREMSLKERGKKRDE